MCRDSDVIESLAPGKLSVKQTSNPASDHDDHNDDNKDDSDHNGCHAIQTNKDTTISCIV